ASRRSMSSTNTIALLKANGYAVRERFTHWHEVLVEGHGETWEGGGTTRDAAIDHALRQMCPSGLAQDLLLEHLTRPADAPTKPVEPRPPSPVDGHGPPPKLGQSPEQQRQVPVEFYRPHRPNGSATPGPIEPQALESEPQPQLETAPPPPL